MSSVLIANTLAPEIIARYDQFFDVMESENLIHSSKLFMHTIRHLYINDVHEYTVVAFSNAPKTEFPLWVVFDADWMYNVFTNLPEVYRWLSDYYDRCTIVEYFRRGAKWEQVQRGTFLLDNFLKAVDK